MPITYVCHGCGRVVAIIDYDVKAKSIVVRIVSKKRRRYALDLNSALSMLRSELPRCPYCGAQLSWAKPLKIEVK